MGRCLPSPTSDRVHGDSRRTVSVRVGLLVLVALGVIPERRPVGPTAGAFPARRERGRVEALGGGECPVGAFRRLAPEDPAQHPLAREPDEARATWLFRRVLIRPPQADEVTMLVDFYRKQKDRFANKTLDPAKIADSAQGDSVERAAWTTVARALLNLDEAVTKS